MTVDIDSYDKKILALLQADARLTMAELGRQVNLSQPAVTERVRKLEAAQIITGYHAQVSAEALGFGIRALLRVGRCDFARMKKLIEKTPEIRRAHNITGEDSWSIEITVRDVAHLDAVISKFCELNETATAIVLKTLISNAPIKQ